MKIKNKNEGITLVALSITIIVLLILAGISISSGTEVIKKAQLEELKTNMLLIQAKAKEYVEDANFKMGINSDTKTDDEKNSIREDVYVTNAQLEKVNSEDIPTEFGITDTSTCYWLTENAQESWGLSKIELVEDEKYLIIFDETKVTVEVYNTEGYDGKYSLTEIEQIQE